MKKGHSHEIIKIQAENARSFYRAGILSRKDLEKKTSEYLASYRDGTSNLYKSMTRIQKRIAKRMLGKAKVIGVILLMMLIFTGNGYMVNQDTQYSIIAKA